MYWIFPDGTGILRGLTARLHQPGKFYLPVKCNLVLKQCSRIIAKFILKYFWQDHFSFQQSTISKREAGDLSGSPPPWLSQHFCYLRWQHVFSSKMSVVQHFFQPCLLVFSFQCLWHEEHLQKPQQWLQLKYYLTWRIIKGDPWDNKR